jgi:NADPH2:quinone reductase
VTALLDSGGLSRGGYAEVADAAPESVNRMPETMPFADGAAFTLTYQTGWFGLHRRARLQSGETLLVHAGAGGVGSAAIQLGKAAGASVIATAGSDEKVDLCRELGADHAINYKTQDFAEEVKRITGGRGADVVFDPIGGDVYDRSTKCIAFEGRIVVVGFTSGRIPQAATNHVLIKNYSVVGLHLGLYTRRAPELIPPAMTRLLDLYAVGKIKPHISARLPLSEARQALAMVAHGKSTGKVILTV